MKTILMINDHPEFCKTVTSRLTSLGFEVRSLKCAYEALQLLDVFDPDLFMIHLIFSSFTGAELVFELRQLPKFASRPMILLISDVEKTLAENSHGAKVLSRQASEDELLSALSSAFGNDEAKCV